MIRILIPLFIAVGGIASGLILGHKLKERQPVLAMVACYSEIAVSIGLAVVLYFKVLA